MILTSKSCYRDAVISNKVVVGLISSRTRPRHHVNVMHLSI
jgi:hypothetical protein